MYELKITSLASKELNEIILYMVEYLINPTAATHFLDAVEKCYQQLANNPAIYEYCRDVRLCKQGYRKAVIQNYVLIYKIEEASKTVYVLHIFYGKRDYQKLI